MSNKTVAVTGGLAVVGALTLDYETSDAYVVTPTQTTENVDAPTGKVIIGAIGWIVDVDSGEYRAMPVVLPEDGSFVTLYLKSWTADNMAGYVTVVYATTTGS